MQQSFPKASGSRLPELRKKEEWAAKEIHLADDKHKVSELPKSPNYSSLIALYLQGNYERTAVPPLFFRRMALLQVLDLSHTSIKSLPKSLPKLVSLKKLSLRGCELFMELSPQVGKLKNLEELDLDETQIIDLPSEIGRLVKLSHLRVSFYHICGKKKSKSNFVIHPEAISVLSQLAELSIDVNPADKRWDDSVEAVVKEACNSKTLKTLSLYLPKFQLLDNISLIYPSLPHFKFTVGHHKRRIISRVPHEVEAEFRNWDKCLKFVNGESIPIEIEAVLKYSSSFFLDNHATAMNLSEFGIENMKRLKFCLLAECNKMETLIDGQMHDERNEDDQSESDTGSAEHVLESLEYLSIYYMENLWSLWRGPNRCGCMSRLKFLALHTCPQLRHIFSRTLFENFVNLEEIIVEDCPQVTSLVSRASVKPMMSNKFFPSLKRLLLLYLPRLVSISNGLLITPKLESIGFYNCPKLKSISKVELSSKTLKIIKGERQWWEDLNWNETEWGNRPDYLMHMFSPISNEKDVMTQLTEDRDLLEATIQNVGQQQEYFVRQDLLDLTESVHHNSAKMQQSVPMASGSGLPKLRKEEEWAAKEIHLTDDKHNVFELPKSPYCSSLIALYLQGNYKLTAIPPQFFRRMALLQVLDLSHTSIKSLPKSLPKLVSLKKLWLRGCELFMELSPQVGKLKNLEELYLDETQIMDLPSEIGKLVKLSHLRVSFYHSCGKKKSKSNFVIHPETISVLSQLAELSIEVNPADKRWDDLVEAVVKEVCNSKTLKTLSLHLPKFQLLDNLSLIYPSLSHFSFTVGHRKNRIVSRVPYEVEAEFRNWDKCLKFVNGENIPIEIEAVLKYSSSFFLDNHATAMNLSEFGIKNMKGLKFCLLAECNKMETLIDGEINDERNEDDQSKSDLGSAEHLLESLEYLSIYYMENLWSIWRGRNRYGCMSKLKFLALHTCPQLRNIFSHTLLENFVNLEEIIVEDCPQVTSLVSHASVKPMMSNKFLPSLKRLLLLYLPGLISISNGLLIAPKLESIGFYNCPKLKSLSKMELSSKTLKIIKGECQWWEDLNWNETERGTRPDYLMRIFTPIRNEKDVMTQLTEDRDLLDATIQNEGQQQDDEKLLEVSTEDHKHQCSGNCGSLLLDYKEERIPGTDVTKSPSSCILPSNPLTGTNVTKCPSACILPSNSWTGTDLTNSSSSCILPFNPLRTFDAPKQALSFFSSEKNKRLEDCYFDQAAEICEVDVDEDEPKAKRSNCTENENKGVIGPVSKTTRGHRVAVRTRSNSVVLDDGYRWRKYGKKKKSVQGNPHPRCYYKCSTMGCPAKKRFERDYQDTSFLITTYEGVHNHGCYNMRLYNLHTRLCNDHRANYMEDAADSAKTISPTKGYEDVFEAPIQDIGVQPEYEGIPEALIRDESQQSADPQPSELAIRMSESPPSPIGSTPWSEVYDCDFKEQELKDDSDKRNLSRWKELIRVPSTGLEVPPDDGFSWRKCGQKEILGSKYPRAYYRCTHRNVQDCMATKQVQRSDDDPTIFEITYHGRHTCTLASHVVPSPGPLENQDHGTSSVRSTYWKVFSMLNCNTSLVAEPQPSEQAIRMSDSQPPRIGSTPRSEVHDCDFEEQELKGDSKKRKTPSRWTELIRVPSTGLEVPPDDGFSWRKCGQKEVLGTKYPRAYYRCTHRNVQNCWATKQVKRSDDDPTIFEITYCGRHTCTLASHVVPSPGPLKNQDQGTCSVLSTYCKAFSMLNCNTSLVAEAQPSEQAIRMSESQPPRIGSTPQSEVHDCDFEEQELEDDSKKRKTLSRWTELIRVPSTGLEVPPDDGFSWRKYEQKEILGSKYTRSY
ncbi:uncharacterized protein LOC111313193 isoform X4 [Durio zibethinus]|uniref:Uncharacterized protein LOC111313193 isoform X4 n=1 Tax=Durio zibethinus TaxID=66656 RepID=A0A6P6AXM9_DURZI|nr:uncharacterized protein LOC111313193 isoform X4 [Durio zibethinus]